MLQRVRTATIFTERKVVVVRCAVFIQNNIFNDGSEATSIPDDGFIFLAKINGLCVATTFDVEDRAY